MFSPFSSCFLFLFVVQMLWLSVCSCICTLLSFWYEAGFMHISGFEVTASHCGVFSAQYSEKIPPLRYGDKGLLFRTLHFPRGWLFFLWLWEFRYLNVLPELLLARLHNCREIRCPGGWIWMSCIWSKVSKLDNLSIWQSVSRLIRSASSLLELWQRQERGDTGE